MIVCLGQLTDKFIRLDRPSERTQTTAAPPTPALPLRLHSSKSCLVVSCSLSLDRERVKRVELEAVCKLSKAAKQQQQ